MDSISQAYLSTINNLFNDINTVKQKYVVQNKCLSQNNTTEMHSTNANDGMKWGDNRKQIFYNEIGISSHSIDNKIYKEGK